MHEYFCSWPDFPSVPGGISILYFSWLVEERPLCFTVSFPSSLASWFWMSWVFPCSLPSSPFWKFPSYNLEPFWIASYSQLVSLPLPPEVRPPEVRGGGNHFVCLSDPIPRKKEVHQSQTMMLCAHTLVTAFPWLTYWPHLGFHREVSLTHQEVVKDVAETNCMLWVCPCVFGVMPPTPYPQQLSASRLSGGIIFKLRDRLPALHGSQNIMVAMSHSQLCPYLFPAVVYSQLCCRAHLQLSPMWEFSYIILHSPR